jgi:hypothetical protein
MIVRALAFLVPPLCAAAAVAAGAQSLSSPDKIRDALRSLAYIQADMASKLPDKAYDRLPHESQEFLEAVPALTDAVAGEPARFRAGIAAQLGKARAAAQAVAELSKTHDEARITAAVAAVDAALRSLEQMFPAELRPVPGQLGHRPQQAGPPPDLR